MNTKKIVLFLLVTVLCLPSLDANAKPGKSFKSDFIKIFKAAQTEFAESSKLPIEKQDEFRKLHKNTLLKIPNAESTFFMKNEKTGMCLLKATLSFDLESEEGKLDYDEYLQRLTGLEEFAIEKYYENVETGVQNFTLSQEEQIIAFISFTLEEGKPTFYVYPFAQKQFFDDLNRILAEGLENRFSNFKGEESEYLQDGQSLSTHNAFRSTFGIYSDFSNGYISVQSYYDELPAKMVHQMFKASDDWVLNIPGEEKFKIREQTERESDDGDIITVIYLSSDSRSLVIQIEEDEKNQKLAIGTE